MRSAAVALILVGCAGCGDDRPTLALGRPPVVLIVLDALNGAHVSHLGYERETTPVLDALAAEGISFEAAYAPAPYTLASIPSLLTGRLPDSHGLTNKIATLVPEERTLAEALSEAGYRTLAAVANVNGGSTFGLDQGFDEMVELYLPEDGRSVDVVEEETGVALHLPRADEYAPLVRRWLAERDPERPDFLYLHVLEPHNPYAPPEEFRALFVDPGYDGPFAEGSTEALVLNKHGKLEADPRDREATRALYDANLRWADHNVGRILDELRAAGLYDEALIVVTSDHGEAFWQHGTWGHNDQLYEEMLRVPLIVKLPAAVQAELGAGLRPRGLASIVDLVPSLLEWLDLPAPEARLDGAPLTALVLAPDERPGRDLLLRSHHRIPHVGLRTPDHKTILERHPKSGETTDVEYYWLAVDPAEQNDLAERRRKEVGPSIRRLERWIREATVRRAEREIPLTVMEEKMLEALGYAGEE